MWTDGDFTVEHCINWTTSRRPFDKSPTFRARRLNFHLEMICRKSFDGDYRLYLVNENGCCKKPVDIAVRVIIGTTLVHHCKTRLYASCEVIWKGDNSDLSSAVSNIEETPHPFSFRIVFYDCVTSSAPQRRKGDKSVQTPAYIDPKFELESLSRDLAKLLKEDHDSKQDLQVVCGDRAWNVHGHLLSVRSDIFGAMLRSDMVERKTGRVDVEDMDPERFQEFLHYLYTGQLPELTVDIAAALYEIGDRYSVAGIRERCASFLTDNLARDNACAILGLADRHSDQAFRKAVVSYVLSENIPMYKEHWTRFCKERPDLAIEVYDQFFRLHVPKRV